MLPALRHLPQCNVGVEVVAESNVEAKQTIAPPRVSRVELPWPPPQKRPNPLLVTTPSPSSSPHRVRTISHDSSRSNTAASFGQNEQREIHGLATAAAARRSNPLLIEQQRSLPPPPLMLSNTSLPSTQERSNCPSGRSRHTEQKEHRKRRPSRSSQQKSTPAATSASHTEFDPAAFLGSLFAEPHQPASSCHHQADTLPSAGSRKSKKGRNELSASQRTAVQQALSPPPSGATTPAFSSQAVSQSTPVTPEAKVLGRSLGSDVSAALHAPWDLNAPKDKDDAAGRSCVEEREPQQQEGSTPGSLFMEKSPSFCCEASEQRPLNAAATVGPPMSLLVNASLLKSGLANESQQAPTTPQRVAAVVRLARCQDLLAPACSRNQTAVHLCLEYHELCRQLHLQRSLGATRADLAASVRWYVPYAVLGLLVGLALVTMFRHSLWLLPLTALAIIILTMVHFARLERCDRLLRCAVDLGAIGDMRNQLRSPLGWASGDGLFHSVLVCALQSLRGPSSVPLIASPGWQPARRSVWVTAGLLLALAIGAVGTRFAAASGGLPMWDWIGPALSTVSIAACVLCGCSPGVARPRQEEADFRLMEVETAVNTLLDVLRPLLLQHRDAGRHSAPPIPRPLLEERGPVSVRLVTSSMSTLRGFLCVSPAKDDTPATLRIICPLAGLFFTTDQVSSATTTDLSGPGVHAGSLTGLGANTNSPSLWLASGFGAHPMRDRRRQDDEVSLSLASASTASTLNCRDGTQVDEASMILGMSVASGLCSQAQRPFEVFRVHNSGGFMPPKAAAAEPALLFALPQESVRELTAARQRKAASCLCNTALSGCKWRRCSSSTSTPTSSQHPTLDNFGVLRTSADLCKLCELSSNADRVFASVGGGPGTPVGFGSGTDSPRSSEAVASPRSEGEASSPASAQDIPSWLRQYLNGCGTTSMHLVVIFDRKVDLDIVFALLRSSQLLPECASALLTSPQREPGQMPGFV